jgi:hypothetical protein
MPLTPQELAALRQSPSPAPPLPRPRGPLSERLFAALAGPLRALDDMPAVDADLLTDEDAVLALYACYELHYRGFAGVDEGWEWEPGLLGLRRDLESAFEDRLRDVSGPVVVPAELDMESALHELLAAGDAGPSLSEYMATQGTLDQLLEFHVHRSAYQLKEADPHSFMLPRLSGAAKAALVEIQADEYGEGREADMHAELYALTLRELGLDDTYGGYLDAIPAVTLATVNCASFFALHRRLRGAAVGHLAVFEMASVEPMGRYSVALRRHGFGSWARLFYDTHVVADAHHQILAARDLAGGLVRAEPQLAADVLLGAQALSAVEARFTRHLFDSWEAGRSSLLAPALVG